MHPREYAASGEYRAEHYRARSDQVRVYTHEYASVGEYAVSISGGVTAIVLKDMPALGRLKSIDQWGDISWTSMRGAFQGAGYMVNLATDTPDLSRVTDMTSMFESTAVNQPLDSWDVSSVTNMNRMFFHAYSFNQPLDSWDVSSVTNMNRMFAHASAFNQPLDSWDVSSVTDMSEMFRDARTFNQPLDSWDVSSVTNMENMFYTANAFNQPLDSWDVSSVTDMSEMFRDARAFNQPLDSWDVSSVTKMDHMFYSANAFNQPLNSWDVSSVTNMYNMLVYASAFNQPLDSWDVSSVTYMYGIFGSIPPLMQNLGKWLIVLNDTTISDANETLAISTQYPYLDNPRPVYASNDTRFVVTSEGISLNPGWESLDGTYPLVITAVVESLSPGPHFRTMEITVDREKEMAGGCLIATAAYGSELAPQVQFLREIRDGTLLSTASGTEFMAGFNQAYYSFSPAIADLERGSPVFRDMVRTAITPAIHALSIMTLADPGSEISVLVFGVLSVGAIAGIYVAGPYLTIRAIKRKVG